MINLETEATQAEQRIRPYVRETPLEPALALSQRGQGHVYLKLENLQPTGSFKLRGAMNKLLTLTPEQRAQGIVTASSGNHGAAVAYGLSRLGLQGQIFVPENASPVKVEMIRRFGAEVHPYGNDSGLTELYARDYADQHGMVYISPYNDKQIIAGQGTIGVELARQLDPIDAVFVTIGGGGLISGIAGYLKTARPGIKVIGCLPENSPVMAESVKAGRIIEMDSLPTLSDGSAGGIEPGAITFELCQKWVDDYVLVSEEEIKAAMRLAIETQHMLIEGAAGVAVAAYLKTAERFRVQNVIIVICGANISLETLKSIL
ncbi:MAG: serine/threonine dehydratase [Chloroflexota bacterium]|nr:MAG: serine/threonine dehydratase [Chloroflexota bacterium]